MYRLISVLIIFLFAPSSHAEWVNVDQFHGLVTHSTPSNVRLEYATKSDGWIFKSGELERPNIEQMNTKPVRTYGSDYIFPSYVPSELLFYTGGATQYSILQDTVTILQSAMVDSCITWQGDSTVRRYISNPPDKHEGIWGSDWLKYTLSDINAVIINSTTYPIWGFYDDSTIVLKDTIGINQNGTDAKDTTELYFAILNTRTSANPPDAFVSNDTVWIVDGGRLAYYATDSAYTPSPPSYINNGGLGLEDTVWHVKRIGDSLLIYSKFDSDSIASDKSWVLLGDTALTNGAHWRGVPLRVAAHLDPSTGYERILVDADSAIYAPYPDNSTFSADGRHLVWGRYPDPGYGPARYLPRLREAEGIFEDHGSYGTPENGYAVFIPFDASWITSTRDWDCRIVLARALDCDRWQARIMKRNDSMMIYLFNGRAPYDRSAYDGDTITALFGIFDQFPATVAPGVNNEYTISCLHRRRAWYGGSINTPSKVTWSYQADYDSISTTGETLEGDDPVTSLSSLGQQLVIYRRHSIEYVTGFSISDFYKVPAPTGVGAASNHCVARNSLDNSDYFVNEMGLWSYNGGGVTEIKTNCPEIFSDSINWQYEKWIWAAVYDRKYWLACPFGTSMTNNRLVVFDLETGDVSFVGGMNPACLYTWREAQYRERLFIGDADSSVIWRVDGAANDLYAVVDRRSGWFDGGDNHTQKRAVAYEVNFDADSSDTLIVDFYIDYAATPVWADTFVVSSSGNQTRLASVGRDVIGNAIAFGLKTPDATVDIMNFSMNVLRTGVRRKQ